MDAAVPRAFHCRSQLQGAIGLRDAGVTDQPVSQTEVCDTGADRRGRPGPTAWTSSSGMRAGPRGREDCPARRRGRWRPRRFRTPGGPRPRICDELVDGDRRAVPRNPSATTTAAAGVPGGEPPRGAEARDARRLPARSPPEPIRSGRHDRLLGGRATGAMVAGLTASRWPRRSRRVIALDGRWPLMAADRALPTPRCGSRRPRRRAAARVRPRLSPPRPRPKLLQHRDPGGPGVRQNGRTNDDGRDSSQRDAGEQGRPRSGSPRAARRDRRAPNDSRRRSRHRVAAARRFSRSRAADGVPPWRPPERNAPSTSMASQRSG